MIQMKVTLFKNPFQIFKTLIENNFDLNLIFLFITIFILKNIHSIDF